MQFCMDDKIMSYKMKLCLIGLVGINLFLILSGLVLPWVISTNKLPLIAIVFTVTMIVCGLVSVICATVFRLNKKPKKKKKK